MKTLKLVSMIFFLLGGNAIQTMNAQERFLVTLKLSKPNYRLDKQSYFEISIKNNTRDTYHIFGLVRGEICTACIAIAEIEKKNGEYIKNGGQNPLISGTKKLTSNETITGIPISLFNDDTFGALPPKAKEENLCKRIRFRIERVFLTNVSTGKSEITTLYSNWIDISGEDFTSVAK